VVDRISSARFNLTRQYRIGLRKLLIDEIRKAAEKRDTTDKRIAQQVGFTPQAYSRLIHSEGQACSVDSLLMYLARLGVGVQLHFTELDDQYDALPNRRKPEAVCS
jgi:predicted XRE-type DNA-binding protein